MKKLQRILSAVLALMMIISLRPPARAAEEDSVALSMTASQTTIQAGGTVQVSIEADKDFVSKGSGMTIYYDAKVLKLEESTAAVPLRIDGPLNVGGKTAVRISCLPGTEAVFDAANPLALLRFKALSAGQTTVTMGAAYLYDELLREIPMKMAGAVVLTVEPSAAYTPDAGYTVQMPSDIAAEVGAIVPVPVTIGNEDGQTGYNAFELEFTYAPKVLELVSTEIPGVTVTASMGEVKVIGYGDDRKIDSVPFALEFKVLKLEDTEVRLTRALVDNAENAVLHNTSQATILDDSTAITVTGYPVTLPDGFSGEDTARPGEDYTFSAPDDYYDYTVTVTIGGREVEVTKNSDGSYTIPAELINGEIVVTAEKRGKIYQVTLGIDMTGAKTAQHGTDYTAVLNRAESARYSVIVMMNGKEYTGYSISGDTYTIPGGEIIGDIEFRVTKTLIPGQKPTDPTQPTNPTDPTQPTKPTDPTKPSKPTDPTTPSKPADKVTMHTVKFSGTGAGAAQGNAVSVAHGSSYSLTLKKESGYDYHVSYRMGGKAAVSVSANKKGVYVIKNVTAPLEIIIQKSPQRSVVVNEYLTLDEKSVFLVQVIGPLTEGKIFTFEGQDMYYSDSYDAWVYLVISDTDFDAAAASQRIATASSSRKTVVYAGGDVTDAKLVYDLYLARYDNFDTVSMLRFLGADVNSDRRIDVRDAVAIIYKEG